MNMKKLLASLLAFCLLICAVPAQAASQTAWNQACTKKLVGSATAFTYDEESKALSSIGTVPAGSYIKQSSDDDVCRAHGVARISWCTGDGSTHSGYIYPSVITSATASMKLPSGRTVHVPEALMADTTELYKHLWNTYEADMRGDGTLDVVADAKAKANDTSFSVEYSGSDGEYQVVSVQELGLVWTDILVGSTPMTVHTNELYWTTTADAEESLAVVYAPKSGKASMYAKKDTASTVIKKCAAGKIVFVLSKGSTYTRVWYDGQIGFMLTSALKFYGPVDPVHSKAAVIVYKGKTNGRAKVNVRMTGSSKSRAVCEPVTGTEVVVLDKKKTWSEIDVNGYHGFIQTKYLQDPE